MAGATEIARSVERMMTAVLMEEEPLWEKNAGWIFPVKLQAFAKKRR